jgi:hypothetical protein
VFSLLYIAYDFILMSLDQNLHVAERSYSINKRQKRPKGQPNMDNSETLATLGTQDTGLRQTKHKNTTQKIKMVSKTDHTKDRG